MKKRTGKGSRTGPKRARTPELFLNRELSWLAFNERVLDEAAEASTPLIERVKFAAITASNLDEYFMVRVARLKNAVREGDADPDPSGLTPALLSPDCLNPPAGGVGSPLSDSTGALP